MFQSSRSQTMGLKGMKIKITGSITEFQSSRSQTMGLKFTKNAQYARVGGVSIQPKPDNGFKDTLKRYRRNIKLVSIQPKPDNGFKVLSFDQEMLISQLFQSSRSQTMGLKKRFIIIVKNK